MEGESWRKINVFKVAAGSDEGDVWTPKCENDVGLKRIEWKKGEEKRGEEKGPKNHYGELFRSGGQ